MLAFITVYHGRLPVIFLIARLSVYSQGKPRFTPQSSVIWKNTSIYDIRRYYFSCYRYLVETGYYLYLSDNGNSLDWRDCSKSRMG
jgi:hypothetical protein